MIHNNIPKPDISPNFTIDDIHKIREWHYKRLKNATIEERIADIEQRAARTTKGIRGKGIHMPPLPI